MAVCKLCGIDGRLTEEHAPPKWTKAKFDLRHPDLAGRPIRRLRKGDDWEVPHFSEGVLLLCESCRGWWNEEFEHRVRHLGSCLPSRLTIGRRPHRRGGSRRRPTRSYVSPGAMTEMRSRRGQRAGSVSEAISPVHRALPPGVGFRKASLLRAPLVPRLHQTVLAGESALRLSGLGRACRDPPRRSGMSLEVRPRQRRWRRGRSASPRRTRRRRSPRYETPWPAKA